MVDSAISMPEIAAAVNTPSRTAGFTGKKKCAILLVAMGTEYAAKIYKYLKPDEIEQLTLEIATLSHVDSDTMNEVLSEFYEMCLAQKFILDGGIDYAKDVLEKAFGVSNAQEIIDKVISSMGKKQFDFMKKVDPKQLFNFIQHEHPQTIALILSYATKAQASGIIDMLPKQKKVEVVERIAKMDRISPNVVREVEESLKLKLSTIGANEITDIGGIKYTAELLNAVDRGTEKFIFEELGKKDAVLVDEIRKLMFVFEDIVNLDNVAMQTLVRDLDPKELVVALKTASEEIQTVFFTNMSKRSGDMIKEDMEYLKGVRASDVAAAQTRIVSKIRELEESGAIRLIHGKDDELV